MKSGKAFIAMFLCLSLCLSLGTVTINATASESIFINPGTPEIFINPGTPGIITIPAEQEAPDEYLATQHLNKALAAIDAYTVFYEAYAFNSAIEVLNVNTYREAARNVIYRNGTGNSYMDDVVTLSSTLPRTFNTPGSISMWSYVHELTHKIEDDHGDIGYTAGITQYSVAYGERNIE